MLPSRIASKSESLLLAWALALGTSIHPLAAAQPSGIIEGTVANARTGEFLENTRVTLAGAGRVVFTDSEGRFRLAPVPAGEARLTLFYTGLPPRIESVSVASGDDVIPEIRAA
ncbi:MAG: carboxypeptidase-like regulatory domain-containing protein [Verrucomicrobia bacterium]|nr:carboxypeptidase-like regulatory domain-containing protein [Verrucomicrobiota bacterium]